MFNKIVGFLLLIAVLPLGSGYYDLLRVIVSIAALINIFRLSYYSHPPYHEHANEKLFVFIPILILFNPIMPVYLYSKPLWIVIDIISGLIFMNDNKTIFWPKGEE